MERLDAHAVVLGAGMAGLAAARVVSEFYDTVTVVERDALPQGPQQRRGVPQARHLHGLLVGGMRALTQLFPGLPEELRDAGVVVSEEGDLSRVSLWMRGHELNRTGRFADPDALTFWLPSRVVLESIIRQHVSNIENVSILDRHDVVDLITDPTHGVTGVLTATRDDGVEKALHTDLVIDATGQGSRLPLLLEKHGYPRPRLQQIRRPFSYASQWLRIPASAVHEKLRYQHPNPGRIRGAALQQAEDNTWVLSVANTAGEIPPQDREGILSHAGAVFPPDIMPVLRDAEPLTEVVRHRHPGPRWQRYDRLRRFPAGLLVMGDALCSLNPIFGQGMAVSACEAVALHDCLNEGTRDLARRFFRQATQVIQPLWVAYLQFDWAAFDRQGWRAAPQWLWRRGFDRICSAAAKDITVAEALLRVQQLIDPPWRLTSLTYLRALLNG
ncbi:FAD-dependent oxidoreductase [Mycobacteroides salmoniphilum]|uniref:Putative epoxidase LasC n=1 Tax=Mycobacteroides salmoniphilum TaxID=404941 RepID=A0A4R8SXH0_9MYCO|nr:FAD-dependent oxidoreductase [Mycobacteroides salmoniphilum]TEA06953.1 putative epoxidase LasC [Mycobacteroides salmoniphilum]